MTTSPDLPAPAPTPYERGWYPDPWGERHRRFWDGTQWTAQVKWRSMRWIANALMAGAVVLAGLLFVLYVLVSIANGMDALPPQPESDVLGVLMVAAWGPFWVGVLIHICRR